MLHKIFTLLLLLNMATGFAQETDFFVNFLIVDNDTEKPIPGAIVRIDIKDYEEKETVDNGIVQFRFDKSERIHFDVICGGYETKRREDYDLPAIDSKNKTKKIRLTPSLEKKFPIFGNVRNDEGHAIAKCSVNLLIDTFDEKQETDSNGRYLFEVPYTQTEADSIELVFVKQNHITQIIDLNLKRSDKMKKFNINLLEEEIIEDKVSGSNIFSSIYFNELSSRISNGDREALNEILAIIDDENQPKQVIDNATFIFKSKVNEYKRRYQEKINKQLISYIENDACCQPDFGEQDDLSLVENDFYELSKGYEKSIASEIDTLIRFSSDLRQVAIAFVMYNYYFDASIEIFDFDIKRYIGNEKILIPDSFKLMITNLGKWESKYAREGLDTHKIEVEFKNVKYLEPEIVEHIYVHPYPKQSSGFSHKRITELEDFFLVHFSLSEQVFIETSSNLSKIKYRSHPFLIKDLKENQIQIELFKF